MIARDFLGVEIEEGDTAVFAQLGYRHFLIGEIDRITPKMLFVKFQKDGHKYRVKQAHHQVIRIEPNELPKIHES